ncbi:MAG: hypothetical protein V4527_01775 [Pseudomonadota bacterium]
MHNTTPAHTLPYRPGYSPAIIRRRPGDGLLACIERHRRYTGWQGPVIVVPA